jgi:TctA family transporter
MSSITTALIVFIGMLGIRFIVPYLDTPFLAPGFNNIMPALMGALSVPFFVKDVKISATPLTVSIILCLTLGPTAVQRNQSYIMPLVMLLAVGVAYVFLKPKGLKEDKN